MGFCRFSAQNFTGPREANMVLCIRKQGTFSAVYNKRGGTRKQPNDSGKGNRTALWQWPKRLRLHLEKNNNGPQTCGDITE